MEISKYWFGAGVVGIGLFVGGFLVGRLEEYSKSEQYESPIKGIEMSKEENVLGYQDITVKYDFPNDEDDRIKRAVRFGVSPKEFVNEDEFIIYKKTHEEFIRNPPKELLQRIDESYRAGHKKGYEERREQEKRNKMLSERDEKGRRIVPIPSYKTSNSSSK